MVYNVLVYLTFQQFCLFLYRKQRNSVTAMKRRAIMDFCADTASTTPSTGLFWKKMKPLLPKSKSNIDGSADIRLLDNGQLIPNPSTVLNDFFASPRIQESVLNLTKKDFSDYPSIATGKNKSCLLDFTFMEIKTEIITENLLKLNPKKATGHDVLSPKILKLSTAALATPLTNLFNYCIRTSTLPSDWKMHKKDEVTDKNNCRPVSVLPAISKLFEKVIFDQLYASLTPILSSNMSGFLKGHSCATAQTPQTFTGISRIQTGFLVGRFVFTPISFPGGGNCPPLPPPPAMYGPALIKLTDDWRSTLDEKKEMGVIAIDLSKAFDCICHNLLLAKVKAYGVQEPVLQLLRPYLHGREQRVICNNKCSGWLQVRCGVPHAGKSA